MNQEKLSKTFIMILNWKKKHFGFDGFYKNILAFQGLK